MAQGKKINLIMQESMFSELQEVAETKGLTASAVIRMLVAEYLEKERRKNDKA